MESDQHFFNQHPDRFAHIRKPILGFATDRQRGTVIQMECEAEFRELGEHKRDRRRIILWRMTPDNIFYDPDKPPILKIPFLLYADETVQDDDETLLPIIHEIMLDEAKRQGVI